MFQSEEKFVGWLRRMLPQTGAGLRLGIGDDAAVVGMARGKEFVLTTDMSIEGVHFSRKLHPPRSVGHRALARALSDIAAMGGTPRFALISLALSRMTTRDWIEEFYTGLTALARRFRVKVIGGDTAVVSGGTLLDVAVTGEVAPGRALRRSGARVGDQVFVSGRLGVSALGLRMLKLGTGQTSREARKTVRAHLYPEPQCALGRFLAARRLASALIDISDGLSTDLARLCEASGVGAWISAALIPKPTAPGRSKFPPKLSLELALHGGEDYQLLFTVPPSGVSRIPSRFQDIALCRIGEITGRRGLLLIEPHEKLSPLPAAGYDHFRKC